MKTKPILFVLIVLFIPVILAGLLASCSPITAVPIATATQAAIATHAAIPTQSPTATPTLTPAPTSTVTPSPTEVAVKTNAVTFIASVGADYSLWVANMDGSGERKLVDLAKMDSQTHVLMQWSPDGKWISYRSGDELWIVSPDGSVKRKLLDLPDWRNVFIYVWSPDSSKIAYLSSVSDENKPTKTPTPGPERRMEPYLVGMIDMTTGEVSELYSFEANAGIPILLWSPNGRDLLFIKDYSFALYELATHKVVKTIKRGCGLEYGFSWSPNGKWFSYTDHGNGRYASQWICVSGLDGSNHRVNVDGTSSTPVWDKTGNFLYFVARKTNPDSIPNLQIDERLMRYDVRTQKTERLLPLREQQTYGYSVSSSSPDGHTLLLNSHQSRTKCDLIFVNIQSLTTTELTLDFESKIPINGACFLETVWLPDSQNLILLAGNAPGHYGSFYTLNIKTGETKGFSDDYSVYRWQVSPIATTP